MQAEVLEDGEVTFAELRRANAAMIECAQEQGVALVSTVGEDMYGPIEMVEPADTSGPVDAEFQTRVVEECQEQEQMLVDRGWAERPQEMSDRAVQLWEDCLRQAGYEGEVGRDFGELARNVDMEVFGSCDMAVIAGLMGPG